MMGDLILVSDMWSVSDRCPNIFLSLFIWCRDGAEPRLAKPLHACCFEESIQSSGGIPRHFVPGGWSKYICRHAKVASEVAEAGLVSNVPLSVPHL